MELFQILQDRKKPTIQCGCKICGEPLKIGEIRFIIAYIGWSNPRKIRFTCDEDLRMYLNALIANPKTDPKDTIALLDIGPDGDIVQEFHGELHHCVG